MYEKKQILLVFHFNRKNCHENVIVPKQNDMKRPEKIDIQHIMAEQFLFVFSKTSTLDLETSEEVLHELI